MDTSSALCIFDPDVKFSRNQYRDLCHNPYRNPLFVPIVSIGLLKLYWVQ